MALVPLVLLLLLCSSGRAEDFTDSTDCFTDSDVVFLVDGSGSVRSSDFTNIKDFIRSMVSRLSLGPNRTRVGVVQYSSGVSTVISLDQGHNRTLLDQTLTGMVQLRSGTNTGAALEFVVREFFSKSSRCKVLILITDGESQADVRPAIPALRRHGVQTYAIGFRHAAVSEMSLIASSPRHLFHVSSTDAFPSLLQPLCSAGRTEGFTNSTGPTPPLPSVSSGWVSPPSPLGPLSSVGAPPQDGGPVLVQWGLNFTVSCFVKAQSLDGYFLLLTPFGNHSLPAANHSAYFLFSPFSSAHWGPYACVYLLQVGCRNLTFHGPALRLKPGVLVSELLIRAAVIFIIFLIYTVTLYFYCYYYYKPKLQQSTRGQRRAQTSDLSLREL